MPQNNLIPPLGNNGRKHDVASPGRHLDSQYGLTYKAPDRLYGVKARAMSSPTASA